MTRPTDLYRFRVVCIALLPAYLAVHGPCDAGETTSPPRFSARVEVARTRERSLDIEAEIAGAKQLFLV
ncbi:MAG: hypothetical protein JJ992_13495, partial [Planctomycetes bacterium]|nr:hypothetical protein [Planctomycetota bacterium]